VFVGEVGGGGGFKRCLYQLKKINVKKKLCFNLKKMQIYSSTNILKYSR
jgi:hypothetical protein